MSRGTDTPFRANFGLPTPTTFTTRLALPVVVALLVAGCGNGRASVPSAPTATPAAVGGTTLPAGPDVVSGAVTDGVGPIAEANVNAWVMTSGMLLRTVSTVG